MNNRKLLIFASFLLLAGCTTDPDTDNNAGGGTSAQTPSAKIVNTSADAAAETLLVYFNDRAVETIESTAAATRTAATRSGIASVDDVLSRLEIVSLERLFTYDARSEEQTRAAGLHKWYILTFGQGADLEKAARELAGVAEVSRIQFDTKLQKASVGNPMPFRIDETGTTRADFSGSGFNDPGLPSQWHYSNNGDKMFAATTAAGADINVPEAWKLTGGSPSIIVAIVDEGVKYTHPDLADNMWVNKAELNGAANTDNDGNGYKNDVHGYNFATNSSDLTWSVSHYDNKGKYDGDSGHGTHVAGTVAAVNNNGKGVCGVAGGTGSNDGVKLMSCQIFSGGEGGSAAVSAEAIKYAADNGASILQCSWGYPAGAVTTDNAYASGARIEKQAIDYFIATKNNAVLDGGLVIFAAGNDAKAMSGYPGAYRDYISVTAFSPDYLPAYYTNYGPGCNVAAPGGDAYISPSGSSAAQVLSTLPSELYQSDYGYMQGTSMACPHVSGVAALGLSYALAKGKQYTVAEFKSMLLTSVNDIDTYLDGTKQSLTTMQLRNYRKQMGTGAIDAYQLLMQIEGTPCLKAKVGVQQQLSLDKYFGKASANLTYLGVEISQADRTKLGISAEPTFVSGKLRLHCTKPGVARITVRAVAGGSGLGTGTSMGGMEIAKEFAVIARAVQTENGGWL